MCLFYQSAYGRDNKCLAIGFSIDLSCSVMIDSNALACFFSSVFRGYAHLKEVKKRKKFNKFIDKSFLIDESISFCKISYTFIDRSIEEAITNIITFQENYFNCSKNDFLKFCLFLNLRVCVT